MVTPLDVPLLHRIVQAILGFLFFHMKLSMIFWRSVKNCVGILMGITLNLQIDFCRIVIFIMLYLLTQEHRRSFHFLISSSISFFKNLKFLLQVFHLFGQTYMKIFYVICGVNSDASLISFLVLYHSYIEGLLILKLVLYTATLLKVNTFSYRNSLIEFLGLLMYIFISSPNI